MLLAILDKVLMVIFILSLLNIIRTSFFLIGSFLKSNSEVPEKFRLEKTELRVLGLSIAYVIGVMITGLHII